MPDDPYAQAAAAYRAAGHVGVLPADLDGDVGKVPKGYTGADGVWPTDEDVRQWVRTFTLHPRNVALRLPEGVIALDVDEAADFEEWVQDLALPTLPPTWSSTSRGKDADRRKYIYAASLDEGRKWRDVTGADVVHRGHRWVRCWPSVNPKIRAVEQWYGPDGLPYPSVPTTQELYSVQLPWEWVEALSVPVHRAAEHVPSSNGGGSGDRRDRLVEASNVDRKQRDHLRDFINSLLGRRCTDAEIRVLAWECAQRFRNPTEPWTREYVDWLVDDLSERDGRNNDRRVIPWEFVERMATEEVPDAVQAEVAKLRIRDQAEELYQEWKLDQVRGSRPKRTAEEFAKLPPHVPIIEEVLAAEVNILSGPSSAGKSLLARDWALSVATGEPWRGFAPPEIRNVLWIASEGLHDFHERWSSQLLWNRALRRIYVLDETVNLITRADVDWLLKEYADERPGLVVFDVIYGMGLPDDNGMRDVLPLMNSLKRISKEWQCSTLALGHPPHGSHDRRMRGTSMWGQLAYTAWHLGDDRLTCEKSKLTNALKMATPYVVKFPHLEFLTEHERGMRRSGITGAIARDFEDHPDDSDRERAARLSAGGVGRGFEAVRKDVARYRKGLEEEVEG